jgi:hyperosmotically inducible protein
MNKHIGPVLIAADIGVASLAPAYAADTMAHTKAEAAQYIDDAAITARIKAKFAEDKTVGAVNIGVETKDGIVQLSGFSTRVAEKARAEEIAHAVEGVKRVENDIIIRP